VRRFLLYSQYVPIPVLAAAMMTEGTFLSPLMMVVFVFSVGFFCGSQLVARGVADEVNSLLAANSQLRESKARMIAESRRRHGAAP
jgi:hypothetical protein